MQFKKDPLKWDVAAILLVSLFLGLIDKDSQAKKASMPPLASFYMHLMQLSAFKLL